jgi:asparagine synthetase A
MTDETNVSEHNSWAEWSRHVLKELERLNIKFESLQLDMHALRNDMSKIDDIRDWKRSLEKEISVKDISQLRGDLDRLKTFKTQAVTIWVVIQGAMAIATAMSFKLVH